MCTLKCWTVCLQASTSQNKFRRNLMAVINARPLGGERADLRRPQNSRLVIALGNFKSVIYAELIKIISANVAFVAEVLIF